jgi:ribosomal protein S18 acetylase RimI-like enzyme
VTPTLRPARPADALAVAGVHVRAWQAAYEGLIDAEFLAALRPEDRAESYSFGADGPAAPETILASEGDEVLGFATTGPSRDADAPGMGEIYALYVDPPHWGAGIGRLLLGEARESLRRRGFAAAILWVLVGNEGAMRFYRADGWCRDGAERLEQPYGVVSRVIRYRRALDR